MRSLALILLAITASSAQFVFISRQQSPLARYTSPGSFFGGHNSLLQHADPLTPSASIAQNSYVPQQSLSPVVSQSPSFPSQNPMESLMSSVIAEATDFVERAELPIAVNNTFSTQPYTGGSPHHGGAHHGGHGMGGHGMGGHNYCKFTPTSQKIGKISNVNIKAYEILTKRYQIPKQQALSQLGARLPEFCRKETRPLQCDRNSRYRTIDGTCNNIQNPYWGASLTVFDRLAPALYEDGWNEPRGAGKALQGTRLPNARVVSLSVHPDFVHPDSRMTNMVPQFGQFLDHDMTLTPESDRRCCGSDANNVDCWPIRISSDDYFYSKLRNPQRCMAFTRSTPYCFPNAEGVREQMNIITGFVDASHVYASENNKTRLLRAFKGGRLLANSMNSGFLPTVEEVQRLSGQHFEFMGTFYGGEERVNEMPGLTVMHTLLFREHNRLADEIALRRPYWDDETIFQESRRLLIAEWQNSVYGEYLPIILGDAAMKRYGLQLDSASQQTYSQYNPSINPTIFHSFADAAYRFGHTLINGLIRMMKGFQDVNRYHIRDNFFNHEQISLNGGEGYDLILGGLMAQNSQTYDTFITEDVTNFLLKERHLDFGGDLIARNLQRGREHGLPGYNVYRQICGLSGLTNSWTNRPSNIPDNVWQVLGSLYETPIDIDLFSGGLSEVPVQDGVTGYTFNCLKSLQFARVKFGDRFFFTHGSQAGSFTPEQIREIRKRTFGDIICANSVVEMTTKNVFKMPSADNPMSYCNDPARNNFNVDIFLYDRV